MKKRQRRGASWRGAVIFFVMVAVIVTCAVLIHSLLPEEMENGAKAGIMLAVIAALAAVCTLADFARRRLTVDKTVDQILEATDAIAAGDFTVRLSPAHTYRRRDELDDIMENINRMAAELAHTETLHTDFIANVSHEIKTPLSVIRNYAAALAAAPDKETRASCAAALISAADRLTALVNNVLKLNKLEQGRLLPAPQRFRLDEMLAEAALAFEDAMEHKHIELDCALDEVEIESYPDYLEIVWNNLLSNAVKFTEAGGRITLRLHAENGCAVVCVADTGCGISPEVGSHIFEKFYQGDTSHTAEGNGLGLALVKQAIDRIGGEIEVESEQGAGTLFRVRLRGA